MAKFTNNDKMLPHNVLDQFKYEIAQEIGVANQIQNGYWGQLSAKDCGRVGGRIGGNMVKVMIKRAEEALSKGI